jgi:hypothetical protein
MILFNGCSFVMGAELPNLEQDRFSKLVCDHFGMEELNIAKGGGSNQRVVRTTFENFNENVKAVVIGWTHAARMEMFNSEWIFVNLSNVDMIPSTVKDYYLDFYSDSQCFAAYYSYILQIQKLCKIANIPLIMFQSVDIGVDPKNLPPEIKTLSYIQQIDFSENIWLFDPMNRSETFDSFSYNDKFEGGHPREDSHRRISKLIIDKLSTKL